MTSKMYLTIIPMSPAAVTLHGWKLTPKEADFVDAGGVRNLPVNLEEGLGMIQELMNDEHPDQASINFYMDVREGKIHRIQADSDGWFKYPVLEAYLAAEPISEQEFYELNEMKESYLPDPVPSRWGRLASWLSCPICL